MLSAASFDRLLTFILLLGVATVAVGAAYSFRIVGIEHIYDFRDKIVSPTILNYLIGMTYSALLPFAFAGFAARKAYWRAGAVLLLLICFYPITLTKIALFTPFWLVGVLLLSKLVEARSAVVLSLLLPIASGLLLVILFKAHAALLFSIVNFRLAAIPSVAMDVYNDFFSRHAAHIFLSDIVPETDHELPLSGTTVDPDGKGLQARQFQRFAVRYGRHRIGRRMVRAGFRVHMRSRHRSWQSLVRRTAGRLYPDLGGDHSPGSSQCAR